jgi:hypothetical protein
VTFKHCDVNVTGRQINVPNRTKNHEPKKHKVENATNKPLIKNDKRTFQELIAPKSLNLNKTTLLQMQHNG